MAGNSKEVIRVKISSLSAFVMLGAVTATDLDTSFYYDDASAVLQLGQGKVFSEIGQGLRELTSLDRCWHNGERHDDLY
jgi:hypothetical protein